MRLFASVLLAGCSAFAYQITYPGGNQGWTTGGPNVLKWQRVASDASNFSLFLVNVNNASYSLLLDDSIDGTLGSYTCETPSGGWPTGFGFQTNIAQDENDPNILFAQSTQFNITAGSSSGSVRTAASAAQIGVLGAVAALTALATTLF